MKEVWYTIRTACENCEEIRQIDRLIDISRRTVILVCARCKGESIPLEVAYEYEDTFHMKDASSFFYNIFDKTDFPLKVSMRVTRPGYGLKKDSELMYDAYFRSSSPQEKLEVLRYFLWDGFIT